MADFQPTVQLTRLNHVDALGDALRRLMLEIGSGRTWVAIRRSVESIWLYEVVPTAIKLGLPIEPAVIRSKGDVEYIYAVAEAAAMNVKAWEGKLQPEILEAGPCWASDCFYAHGIPHDDADLRWMEDVKTGSHNPRRQLAGALWWWCDDQPFYDDSSIGFFRRLLLEVLELFAPATEARLRMGWVKMHTPSTDSQRNLELMRQITEGGSEFVAKDGVENRPPYLPKAVMAVRWYGGPVQRTDLDGQEVTLRLGDYVCFGTSIRPSGNPAEQSDPSVHTDQNVLFSMRDRDFQGAYVAAVRFR